MAYNSYLRDAAQHTSVAACNHPDHKHPIPLMVTSTPTDPGSNSILLFSIKAIGIMKYSYPGFFKINSPNHGGGRLAITGWREGRWTGHLLRIMILTRRMIIASVLGGMGMATAGLPVRELADLNGRNGFVLNGVAAGDEAGFPVSAAGDINRDGVDDLLIGASRADPNGDDSGASYVVFGGAGVGNSGAIALSALNGTNGFVLNGVAAGDESGG